MGPAARDRLDNRTRSRNGGPQERGINKLIWGPPAPKARLGRMDPAAFARTAKIALAFGVIRKPADPGAYTHKVWERATR